MVETGEREIDLRDVPILNVATQREWRTKQEAKRYWRQRERVEKNDLSASAECK